MPAAYHLDDCEVLRHYMQQVMVLMPNQIIKNESKGEFKSENKSSIISTRGCSKGGKWNPNCSCLFSSLPQGVLVQIQSYLPIEQVLASCALVCTRWRAACESPLLYRFTKLVNPSQSFFNLIVRNYGRYIVSLDVQKGKRLSNTSLALVSKHCNRSLESLTLTHIVNADADAMDSMIAALKSLNEVNFFASSSVQDSTLKALSELRSLSVLGLAYTSISSTGLECFQSSSASQNLQVLDVQGCMTVRNPVIKNIVEFAPNLRVLRINGSSVTMTDDLAVSLGKYAPQLEELNGDCSDTFMGNQLLSDKGVIKLSEGCVHIKKLHLMASSCLSDASVYSLSSSLKGLEDFDVSFCGQVSTTAVESLLVSQGKTLKRLYISDMDRISPSEGMRLKANFPCVNIVI